MRLSGTTNLRIFLFLRGGFLFPDRAAQDAPPEPTWMYSRRVRKKESSSEKQKNAPPNYQKNALPNSQKNTPPNSLF
jgi:hypothetical protein